MQNEVFLFLSLTHMHILSLPLPLSSSPRLSACHLQYGETTS